MASSSNNSPTPKPTTTKSKSKTKTKPSKYSPMFTFIRPPPSPSILFSPPPPSMTPTPLRRRTSDGANSSGANANSNPSPTSGCSPIPKHLLKSNKNHYARIRGPLSLDDIIQDLDTEAKFLNAVEFGDVALVKRLLKQHPNINVDCVDGLGRTPLRLAVKNENKDLVEILLGLSSANNLHESLLQAIDAGLTSIAETTLKHPRYIDVLNKRRRMGDTDGFFKPEHGSQFPSYVTPLNLAAQKDQYVIVKLLLQRGETIARPHKFSCSCQECINKNKFDQLRMAKCRLDAYRGLASEAYICLNFLDPILTAMELAQELKKQAYHELYFKIEYNELADQLTSFVVKLLDRVWTHRELNVVLDKTGSPWEDSYESLARLKMALDFHQKKFVAHANCQQRIVQRWYKGTTKFSRAKWNQKLVIIVLSFLAFPVAVLVFLVRPNSKFAGFLRLPTVKFISHALSYFLFLSLIIYSCKEIETQISNTHTLLTTHPSLHAKYALYRNRTGRFVCGHDFPVRMSQPTVTGVMLTTWVSALIVQECQELWSSGLLSHVQNYYNFMDFLLLSIYTASFTMRYLVMDRVVTALEFLGTESDITKDPGLTESHIYWLNADRRFWFMTDPMNMMEGLFAMANILSFTRISYLLPANEMLGPLQISLGRMVADVFRFLSLSAMVIAGFMVSLRNLFWYYAKRRDIELNPDIIEDPTAVTYYGSDKATFRTVFWAIFGRGGIKAVSLGGYNNTLTEQIGQAIDSLYHITMLILLLNIFIAMMTRSYEQIAADEDVEWKFARSSLYMDYISEAKVLPVPLNILEIIHGAIHRCIRSVKRSRLFRRPIQRVRKSFSDRRRRPGMVATKSTKDKIKHRFTRAESTEMGTIERHPSTRGISKNRSVSRRTTTYQEVVQRIVHRYIMDVQRQNEDGGNADEIRSSMDMMKTEIFTNCRLKDENLAIAAEAMNTVALDLGKMAHGDLDTDEFASMCALLDWWREEEDEEEEEEGEYDVNSDNVFGEDRLGFETKKKKTVAFEEEKMDIRGNDKHFKELDNFDDGSLSTCQFDDKGDSVGLQRGGDGGGSGGGCGGARFPLKIQVTVEDVDEEKKSPTWKLKTLNLIEKTKKKTADVDTVDDGDRGGGGSGDGGSGSGGGGSGGSGGSGGVVVDCDDGGGRRGSSGSGSEHKYGRILERQHPTSSIDEDYDDVDEEEDYDENYDDSGGFLDDIVDYVMYQPEDGEEDVEDEEEENEEEEDCVDDKLRDKDGKDECKGGEDIKITTVEDLYQDGNNMSSNAGLKGGAKACAKGGAKDFEKVTESYSTKHDVDREDNC